VYVDLRPWNTRPVEVLIDGIWRPGELQVYRQRDGRWEGWVRWSASPGSQYIGWYAAAELRAASWGPDA
jgi:hypothetical protein